MALRSHREVAQRNRGRVSGPRLAAFERLTQLKPPALPEDTYFRKNQKKKACSSLIARLAQAWAASTGLRWSYSQSLRRVALERVCSP